MPKKSSDIEIKLLLKTKNYPKLPMEKLNLETDKKKHLLI